MKNFKFILLFIVCGLSAQKNIAFDSIQLNDVKDLFADDYGNVYLAKNKDFSFTKYDSLGNQVGKLMFTLPFKIQSVQNLLNIPAFSENAQEVKYFDQNLNEIQTISFRQKFGFVKYAYAEDLQVIWLLEESTKRLIQYNFREDRMVNSFPFNIDFENIRDFLVFDNQVFLLTSSHFRIYNFNSEQILEIPIEKGKRLRRENKKVFLLSKDSVHQLENENLVRLFYSSDATIVDKNSRAYFVLKGNKLYLYPINK